MKHYTNEYATAPLAVAFVTLGCAKNEVDSQDMARRLLQAGIRVIDQPADADCVIVNTCSFIQEATEESIGAILEAAELDNVSSGSAKLIVAGCMPARYGQDLQAELHEASAFVPCNREDDIVTIVQSLFPEVRLRESSGDIEGAPSCYVKISDGCNRFCSFCTIPYIRGRYHSFSYDDINQSVYEAEQRGAREIVLIAQDTGRWGEDFNEPLSLAWLLEHLAEEHPTTWIRVMYIQPEGISDELLNVVARYDNICSYLDIPFQHCDTDILHAMNRKGSSKEYLDLIQRIRKRIPGVTLRTTLMAGFPGESDEVFEELLSFVEEAEMDYVGVFAYSQEERTRAAELPGQISDDCKLERAQRLRDVADSISYTRVARRIGTTMDVLVLGCEEDGQLYGRAMCQAPDVDGVVYLNAGNVGQIMSVTITDTLLYEMEGE